ncbi:hypothetical protein JCM8547_001876 [Rhodosporidiobolus lusitaniae]
MAALREHAFYCFEIIHAEINGTQPCPPPFDGAEKFPLFVTWNIQSKSNGEYRLRGCIGNFGAQPLGEGLTEYAKVSAFEDHRFDPITAKELPRLECGVSLLTDFERCDDYLDWELGTHGVYVEFANPALKLSPSQLSPPPTSAIRNSSCSSSGLPPLGSSSSTPSSASTSSSSVSSTPASKPSYRSLSALPKLKLALPSSANPRNLPPVLHATFLPEVAEAQGWDKVETIDAATRKAGFKGTVTEDMRSRAQVSRYQSKKVKVDFAEWKEWRKEQGYE